MTLSVPPPTAPPTSSLPALFKGLIMYGFEIYPLTRLLLSETATISFISPPPFIWSVRLSVSFLSDAAPIIAAPVSNLPSAAVATGYVACILCASFTRSVVTAANTRIAPSMLFPLTSLSGICFLSFRHVCLL